jgi:periplasmic copper chaperone A
MLLLDKSLCVATCVLAVFCVMPVSAQPLTIDNARIRAMPPGATSSAAYLTLTNASPATVTIIGASSPAAGRVELHTTLQQDGMMRMRAVAALPLAPAESVELTPGGLHLMIMQAAESLVPGATLRLCLRLAEHDEAQCFDAPVVTLSRQNSLHRH